MHSKVTIDCGLRSIRNRGVRMFISFLMLFHSAAAMSVISFKFKKRINKRLVETEKVALDREAAAAILKDLEKKFADDDNYNIIPQLLHNRPPTGWDSIDCNIEIRPDESTTKEYNDMPICEFGTALLRGMGWKKSTNNMWSQLSIYSVLLA